MSDATNLKIHTGAGIDGLRLLGCEGRDAVSELFSVRALIARTTPLGDDEIVAMMQGPCALSFGSEPGARLAGVVSDLCALDTCVRESRYLVTVEPTVSLLSHSVTSRAWIDTAVPDVVRDVLGRYRLSEGTQHQAHLAGHYPPRPFVVQYEESDWSFVSRWLEHYGIGYWFSHEPSGDVLHWADENQVSSARRTVALGYAARSELQQALPTLFELDRVWQRRPGRFLDGHFDESHPTRVPRFEGHAMHPLGFGRIHEFGGPRHATEEEGTMIARRRAERLRQELTFLRAVTNAATVRAGVAIAVEGSPGPERLLVTATRFAVGYPVDAPSARGAAESTPRLYRAELDAIPAELELRPARRTPWPRIDGVVLAYVVSEQGRIAMPDGQGRYRVALPFVSPETGGARSARIAVAQPSGGSGEGAHVPLRGGTPVLLAFHRGDPDQPFIVGVVGNATTRSVVGPDTATRSVLRTASGIHIELEDRER